MNKQWVILGAGLVGLASAFTVQPQITIDQFGFRPDAIKVAVLASPVSGQDASGNNPGLAYAPGASFKICAVSDVTCASPVFTGTAASWNSGAADTDISGDKVWWADFSTLQTAGEYYLYDPTNNVQSHPFKIAADVYAPVLKAATRMFFYQREGIELTAANAGNWAHQTSFAQDAQAKSWLTKDAPRDVHGGWMDAGDMNKYVPFTAKTLSDLLMAYEFNAGAFPDDWNIPESGNGIPDLLDEVKWELDWMLRMQESDGGVHNRVAYDDAKSPNGDPAGITTARYYTAVTSWATSSFIVGAANASRFYTAFPATKAYADTLLRRSLLAWNWLQAHPGVVPTTGLDYGSTKLSQASQAPVDNDAWSRVWAAVELYRATGKEEFKSVVDAAYKPFLMDQTKPDADLVWDPMLGTHSPAQKNYGYLQYVLTPGAKTEIVDDMKSALQQINWWYDPLAEITSTKANAYRVLNWYYTWGSNHTMSNWGLVPIFGARVGVSEATTGNYTGRGEEYIHYLHGRNPLGMSYLTNMGAKGANAGAEKFPMDIFHTWFQGANWDGANSQYGPAPGYLVGGPNQSGKCVETIAGRVLPEGQPPMKMYVEGNVWAECHSSWEFTEPGIYYQAAYVHLLSHYVPGAGTKATLANANYPADVALPVLAGAAPARPGALWLAQPAHVVVSAVRTDGKVLRLFAGEKSGSVSPRDYSAMLPAGMWLIRVQGAGQQAQTWLHANP